MDLADDLARADVARAARFGQIRRYKIALRDALRSAWSTAQTQHWCAARDAEQAAALALNNRTALLIAELRHDRTCASMIDSLPARGIVDRAEAFVSYATARLSATPVQVMRALATAGDEDAQTIVNVCEKARVTLLPYPSAKAEYGPRQTLALGVIRRLIERCGAMQARRILAVVANSEVTPISADHIRIGEALMSDPAYMADFDEAAVADAIRSVDHQIAPTLVGDSSGNKVGTQAKQFRRLIMGTLSDQQQVKERMRFGLINPHMVNIKGGTSHR
ncbi:MAG: hypothetical protein ACRYGP_29940 [Janthinobacterium lividum]